MNGKTSNWQHGLSLINLDNSIDPNFEGPSLFAAALQLHTSSKYFKKLL
jgi:hypothetical protein